MDVLEQILSSGEWLVDGTFSVADVAVGSYLNYVPLFFPQTDLSSRPAIAAYMDRCAARPKFAEAFGDQHAAAVRAKCKVWQEAAAGTGKGGGGGPFGMFK